MSDFEHFAVHKSADSLSVHKARMARPRFAQESQAAEDEEDELDVQDEQPDSPAADTEVQGRVDSIALAQKRLSAKSSEKSRFENQAPKSRFGRVKLPEESEEAASDDKKIKVGSGRDTCVATCKEFFFLLLLHRNSIIMSLTAVSYAHITYTFRQ